MQDTKHIEFRPADQPDKILDFMPYTRRRSNGTYEPTDDLVVEFEDAPASSAEYSYGFMVLDFDSVSRLKDFLEEWMVRHWPEETDDDS